MCINLSIIYYITIIINLTSIRYAYFGLGGSCPENHFNNMNMVFDLTFCGDWVYFIIIIYYFIVYFKIIIQGWSSVWKSMPQCGIMPIICSKQSQRFHRSLLATPICFDFPIVKYKILVEFYCLNKFLYSRILFFLG